MLFLGRCKWCIIFYSINLKHHAYIRPLSLFIICNFCIIVFQIIIVLIFDIIKFHFSSSVKKRDDITRLFFRFSLYGGDSPTFLGFHFMVETHLRQFFVYNKYMQFSLKNQYNSIIFQKYKPPKEHSLRGL